MLSAVVVFGRHNDFVSDEEGGVESHTELADQLRSGLSLRLHLRHLIEELAGARLGNGAQIFHQLIFGHSNTSISDVEHVLLLVRLEIQSTQVNKGK